LIGIPGDTETGVGPVRILRLIIFAVGAWRHVLRIRPDIVVCDPPPTSALATTGLRKVRRVYYIADSWADMLAEGGGALARALAALVRPIERLALRNADLVIAVRDNLADTARRAGATTVVTAPYGTDLTTFNPDGDVWMDPWDGGIPYFLYAGNFGVVQGATVFLEAAERVWSTGRRFGVVYMGYGSDLDLISDVASRYPETFRLLPMQDPAVTASAFRGAVAALASMRPIDVTSQTRPAKALAALACGCPVVFAGAGAFAAEVAAGELGLATDWRPEPVAEAMSRLLDEAEQQPTAHEARRRRAAMHAAENFDIARSAARLADRICTNSATAPYLDAEQLR
jgi:glycosyltransferase involved in cell wall biosynthesis